MKVNVSVFILAFVLMASLSLSAQTKAFLNLSGVIPSGEYAEGEGNTFGLITSDNEGGAGFGFNAGLKVNIPINLKGLSVMVSLDGIYNSLNSDLKDFFEDYVDSNEPKYEELTLTKPQYINIPLIAGLNYTYRFNDQYGLFAEAGLGPDLRIVTKMEEHRKTTIYKEIYTRTYDPKISLAYQLGGGIEINRRFTVGVNFYNLGKAKIKGKATRKIKYTGGTTNTDSVKFNYKRIQSTVVMFRLGISL